MKQIFISSTLKYLRFFARKSLASHQPEIIGIAGSVGKSSTKNAVQAILQDHFPTKAVGNSETGIPLGILGMKPENYSPLDWLKMITRSPFNLHYLKGTKYLIAEMGIDDPFPPKNMEYLLTILKPDIAISLNATATHTMQFEKALTKKEIEVSEDEKLNILIDKIAEEDTKIITQSGCKVGIYNADDPNLTRHITTKTPQSTKLLSFGDKNIHDVSYGIYSVSLKGTSFVFFIRNGDKREELTLTFNNHILPREYREVFAAAILAARETGLSLTDIKSALEKNYSLPKGRSSLFEGINGSVIIDSTYNASKASVTAFLDLVNILKKETSRPLIFLFGDMRELGDEAAIEHREVAEKIIGIVDRLYLVGPLTREFVLPTIQEKDTLFKEIRWFDTAIRAGEFIKENMPKDAIILAKGSQNTIFLEEAVKLLLKNKKESNLLCRQEEFWLKTKGIK